jgi:hypothetical protein
VAPGTIVGMDPWVINRNEEIFGTETDSFKPERWLQYRHESVDQFNARYQKMFSTVLSFGSGARACYGQSLGLVELYKSAISFWQTSMYVTPLFCLLQPLDKPLQSRDIFSNNVHSSIIMQPNAEDCVRGFLSFASSFTHRVGG